MQIENRKSKIQNRRGFTLIEVLIAALIVGFSLASLVSLWYFSYQQVRSSDATGMAYEIARTEIEQIKETGFNYQQTTTTTSTWTVTWSHYYDTQGNLDTSANPPSATDAYQAAVTLAVASPDSSQAISSFTQTADTSSIVYLPSNNALIQVTVTITEVKTGRVLYQTGVFLARSGV